MISERLSLLLKQEQKLFHTQDLALLWGVENRQTLLVTISRYVKKGILIPIHKGFYSLVPISELDPILLGTIFLHFFSYVSTETVLSQNGIIKQIVYPITLISKKSTSFKIAGKNYKVRGMKEKFLLNLTGIEERNKIFWASIERAVADMLYFNKKYYFDQEKLIDWKKVKEIQKEVGYAGNQKRRCHS